MKERDRVQVSKEIEFEKSGETINITLTLNNVSPDRIKKVIDEIDIMYNDLKTTVYLMLLNLSPNSAI